ncbi:MAG: single-stranded-DNA-specific exonuclease RecJ [Phycisphaerales bacterium]|nr:single-stranded-DNA-specific exonuclease RecJ [Phycisphaerales bacterium]
MQGLTHRWAWRPSADPGGAMKRFTSPPSPVSMEGAEPLVARVLAARGLGSPEAAAEFLRPSLKGLHDPGLMPNLDRAAERLLVALRAGERIVIYGDYDVDGVCASAILFHVLRAIAGLSPEEAAGSARIRTYVPHRLDEGYGLHVDAIEQLAAEGARVIVSVDCGVTAAGPARRAAELGVCLIITDHHNLPDGAADRAGHGAELPAAFAIVHPRLPGGAYPFGDLCGAGVAFKLAWRLATMDAGGDRAAPAVRRVLLDMMALAGIATIADVVPLVGENRLIAGFGLARVKDTEVEGLRALVEASGLGGAAVTSEDAGFKIGPRLNACGRLGHAREAVELLTTARGSRAAEIAAELDRTNRQRQATERAIFEQSSELAEAAGMTGPERRAIVLTDERWHAGVVGIVCSRLVGRYHRPAILLARDGDVCKGSGRSIDGFNLHAAIAACSAHVEKFGGHDMAAGLTCRADAAELFARDFIEHASRSIAPEQLTPELSIDCEATVEELTESAVRQLRTLGPFGRGNPAPSIVLRNVRATRGAESFGAEGRHMSVFVRGRGERELRLVGWGMGDRRGAIRAGATLDVVVRPEINEWQGRIRVEPVLSDLRLEGL